MLVGGIGKKGFLHDVQVELHNSQFCATMTELITQSAVLLRKQQMSSTHLAVNLTVL